MKITLLLFFLSFINAQIALPTFQAVHKPHTTTSSGTFTFTNCSATGKTGPTQSQVNSTYTSGNSLYNGVTINTQGIQEWTVPETGTYRIVVSGAAAGTNGFGRGGYGATVTVDVSLTQSQVLAIVVGQMGTGNNLSTNFQSGTGGGGGSFVYEKSSVTYYAAVAGGGGAHTSNTNLNSDTDDADGKYNTTSGTTITSGSYNSAGGTSGNGGSNSTRGILYGGTGAGVNSNGATHNSGSHGLTRANGWLGGTGVYLGGFGGGGSSYGDSPYTQYKWSGGGGGYSGGGSGLNRGNSDGQYGGGGGSYYSGTLVSGTNGANQSHGSVTITKQ
jgi:hypothetical protein